MNFYVRTWATPLTVGSFALMAITGLLIFFHWDSGLNKAAHEWLGWLLVAAVGAHLALNWKSFQKHLQRPVALGIIGACAVLLGLSFLPVGGGGGGNPMRLVTESVLKAPLTSLAPLVNKTPDELTTLLRTQGLNVQNPQADTLGSLTDGNREKQMNLLRTLFTPPTP